MPDNLKNGITTIVLNSDENEKLSVDCVLDNDNSAELLVRVRGSRSAQLSIRLASGQDSRLTFILINENDGDLVINEEYELQGGSVTACAFIELNSHNIRDNAHYSLLGEGAELTVQSATLTGGVRKVFDQKVDHLAGNTQAHVNNLGVVLSKGYAEFVVTNTIEKGMHGSSTHQTSRLLTYDKTAIGRILPILNIRDNDVQASHAASLGQPDEGQMFYLQTRGLSRSEALKLIVTGYLLPVTDFVSDEDLKRQLMAEIERKVAEECSI